MRKNGRCVFLMVLLMGEAMECNSVRVVAILAYFQFTFWRKVSRSVNDLFEAYKAVSEVLVRRGRR